MKSIHALLIVVSVLLLLVGCPMGPQQSAVEDQLLLGRTPGRALTFTDNPSVIQLWAGGGTRDTATLVGSVILTVIPDDITTPEVESDTLHVQYNLTDSDGVGGPDIFPWVVTEIHHEQRQPDTRTVRLQHDRGAEQGSIRPRCVAARW
jgi:hypothetical protein